MKKIHSNIIRGFVRNTINEAFSPEELFTTDIKKERISMYNESSYEKFNGLSLGAEEELGDVLRPSSAKVTWALDLELRDWGIKNISLSIKNVILEIDVVSEGEVGYQTVTINAAEEGFGIVSELKIENSSSVVPYDIEIDFLSKKINVS